MSLALAAGLVLLAGLAIGATSIGGVLVVPALSGVAGVPVREAVAASSFAFLLTGLAGLRIAPPAARGDAAGWPLHAGAFVGAAGGAALVYLAPAAGVRTWVALFAFGSGLYTLVGMHAGARRVGAWPRAVPLALIGAAVGLASALSGTGGPVALLPVCLLLGVPILPSVASAQLVQVPVALAASLAHGLAGNLNLRLGVLLGALLVVGAWLGRGIARRVAARGLQRATALGLMATGLLYGLL